MAIKTYLDGNLRTWTVPMTLGLPFTGSAYRAPDGTVVWIDPPEPGTDEAVLLELGKPSHILVTFRDHDRAVKPLAQKFNARVWAPRGKGGFPGINAEFDEMSALPTGLRAVGLPAMGYGEHALVAEAYGKRFAFIGDAVFNFTGTTFPWLAQVLAFSSKAGTPLMMKRNYRGGDTRRAPEQLRKLLNENLDLLVLSHGEAIPTNADRHLRVVLGLA